MENQQSQENSIERPVWTGEVEKDVASLNTYIEAVGRSRGATERRIEDVKVQGDALLTEGGGIWALFSGIGDGSPDNHELYNELENTVNQNFDGTDEEYFASGDAIDDDLLG